MQLRCPRCKSKNLLYSGTSTVRGGYGSTDARYTCKDCDYIGSFVIDTSEETEVLDNRMYTLPVSWSLIIAIIAILSIGLGEDIKTALIFFIILSGIPALFFYIIGYEYRPVEDDLKNLDENGFPRELIGEQSTPQD